MSRDLKTIFGAIVGPAQVLVESSEMAVYLNEWRGTFDTAAAAVVRPGSTAETAEIVRVCAQHGIGVVPQGGNTGLVGGAAAQSGTDQIIVSLSRMSEVREIDVANNSITVEAGCVLAAIQTAAERQDRLFPLSLGAEGSCQIGGNLAANAGGVNVLRYGNARDLCLGLEVVLADGSVLHGLSSLRKDNTGYDLKHLFIGSEGSLGIITAATLKLFPRPQQKVTALVALTGPESALCLLNDLQQETGGNLVACELIPRFAVELVCQHIDGCRDPFDQAHAWYLLVEAATPARGGWLADVMEQQLAQAIEQSVVQDAVIAQSLRDAEALWRIRENIPEAQVREGASIKHDISVPVSRVPELIRRAGHAVTDAVPGVRVCAFGHAGDGNLHFNLSQPADSDAAAFVAQTARLNRIVHDIVNDMTGSFSAEHGVGRLKVEDLTRYKSEQAVTAMQKIKQALDPDGLMNPGVIFQ